MYAIIQLDTDEFTSSVTPNGVNTNGGANEGLLQIAKGD